MTFGFSFNNHTADQKKHIIFSEAIHPSSGPAASIHLFYGIEDARRMMEQLQQAIAQAEAVNNDEVPLADCQIAAFKLAQEKGLR